MVKTRQAKRFEQNELPTQKKDLCRMQKSNGSSNANYYYVSNVDNNDVKNADYDFNAQQPTTSQHVQHNLPFGKSLSTLDSYTRDYEQYQEGMGICKHCAEALGMPCYPMRPPKRKKRGFWHQLTKCFRTKTVKESCPICKRCAAAKKKRKTEIEDIKTNTNDNNLDLKLKSQTRLYDDYNEKQEKHKSTKIINIIRRKPSLHDFNLSRTSSIYVRTNKHFYNSCYMTPFNNGEIILKRMKGELPTKENFFDYNFFICRNKRCERYIPTKVFVHPNNIIKTTKRISYTRTTNKRKKTKNSSAAVIKTKQRSSSNRFSAMRIVPNNSIVTKATKSIDDISDSKATLNEDDNKPTTSRSSKHLKASRPSILKRNTTRNSNLSVKISVKTAKTK